MKIPSYRFKCNNVFVMFPLSIKTKDWKKVVTEKKTVDYPLMITVPFFHTLQAFSLVRLTCSTDSQCYSDLGMQLLKSIILSFLIHRQLDQLRHRQRRLSPTRFKLTANVISRILYLQVHQTRELFLTTSTPAQSIPAQGWPNCTPAASLEL